jgi:hypothetical protein
MPTVSIWVQNKEKHKSFLLFHVISRVEIELCQAVRSSGTKTCQTTRCHNPDAYNISVKCCYKFAMLVQIVFVLFLSYATFDFALNNCSSLVLSLANSEHVIAESKELIRLHNHSIPWFSPLTSECLYRQCSWRPEEPILADGSSRSQSCRWSEVILEVACYSWKSEPLCAEASIHSSLGWGTPVLSIRPGQLIQEIWWDPAFSYTPIWEDLTPTLGIKL